MLLLLVCLLANSTIILVFIHHYNPMMPFPFLAHFEFYFRWRITIVLRPSCAKILLICEQTTTRHGQLHFSSIILPLSPLANGLSFRSTILIPLTNWIKPFQTSHINVDNPHNTWNEPFSNSSQERIVLLKKVCFGSQ